MAEGLLVAGIGLQVFGQIKANEAQADAERQNAAFFDMQKKQAEQATRRAQDLFEDESDFFIGDQVSAFSKAGIDISGSALLQIAGVKGQVGREKAAIAAEGRSTATLAGMRADNARSVASQLSSTSMRNLAIASGAARMGAATLPSINNYFLDEDT